MHSDSREEPLHSPIPGYDGLAPAEPGRRPKAGGAMEAAATAGIFGLIGIAAVLMLVLTLILAFLVVAAVAPGVLI